LLFLVTSISQRSNASYVQVLVIYSLHPKFLECFDWNTNIKEFVRNL
jgi:hypothetical protein